MTESPSTGVAGSAFDLFLFAILFLPTKIDILSVGANAVRLDDVILAAILLRHYRLLKTIPAWLLHALAGLGIVTAAAFLSGAAAHRVPILQSLLYGFRAFEYVIPLLLGMALARGQRRQGLHKLLLVLAALLAVLSVAQVMGLDVGASKFAYSRAAGNTGGPYELAAVAALLIFDALQRKAAGTALFALIPLVLSASRTTVIATLVIVLFTNRRRIPQYARVAALGIVCLAIISTIFLRLGTQDPNGIQARLQSTGVTSEFRTGCAYASSVGPVGTQDAYFFAGYQGLSQQSAAPEDQSSLIRFSRWCLLVKSLNTPELTLLGLGPSFAGAAVDGQYVRYLVEGGAIGLFSWAAFWIRMCRRGPPSVLPGLLALLATGIFIDILVAARPMELLWLLVGAGLCDAKIQAPSGEPLRVGSVS